MKATLLAANGFEPPSDFEELHRLADATHRPTPAGGTSLVIVRDPARRFVSAVLDRIVAERRPATWHSITRHPVVLLVAPHLTPLPQPAPARELVDINALTFLDLTRAVALIPDAHLEHHLRSQSYFIAGREHDHVVSMEQPGWADRISEIVGAPFIEVRPHGTQQHAAQAGTYPDAALMTIGELRALYRESNIMPCADDLLSGEVGKLIRDRFAEDYRYLADHAPPTTENPHTPHIGA